MGRAEIIQEIVENLAKCQRPSFNAAWKKSGLSHAQMGMLYMLGYHKQLRPKEIVDYMGISKSAVTQLMDPLIDKKLVRREIDSKDRRLVRLSLESNGTKLFQKLNKHKYAGIRSGLDSLDTKDLEQLNKLHQKMFANISSPK